MVKSHVPRLSYTRLLCRPQSTAYCVVHHAQHLEDIACYPIRDSAASLSWTLQRLAIFLQGQVRCRPQTRPHTRPYMGGGNSWLGATSFAGLQQGPSHYNDTFTFYYVFTSTSAQFSMCGKHHSHSEDKTFRHRCLTSDPASVTVPNRLLVDKPNSFSTSSTQMRRTSESCVLSLSSAAG